MKIQNKEIKILIIHGPNMNLLGLRTKNEENKITLDKLNVFLKKEAKNLHLKLKFIQTNDESKAVTLIQQMRNKIAGIIIFPCAWQSSGYVLKDTLDLLGLPYYVIFFKNYKINIFKKDNIVFNINLYEASILALSAINKNINK